MNKLRALVLAAAALAWPGGLAAAEDLTIEHQGIARHYLIHQPAENGAARPLLVYLHGLRPADWQNRPWAEIDAAADREGFVAIYPAALQGRWNFSGQRDEKTKAGDLDADDLGFIGKLIDDLIARQIADPKRVYAFGESRGGVMSFELMCHMAERIAAAGPLISGMIEAQRDACKPDRAVPLFALAGTNDPVQQYDGWLLPTGRLLSVPETMEFWRLKHGCTGQQSMALPHRVPEDTTRILLVQWTGCAIEDAVRLYRVNGGGHRVPSLIPEPESDWTKKAGRQNLDIETVDEFWNFAKRFSR